MAIKARTLCRVFQINEIYSIHHFICRSDFLYKTELHPYWTLLYVEEGIAELSSPVLSDGTLRMEQGDLYLQAPGEYFSVRASEGTSPLLFTIGFHSEDSAMESLQHCRYTCDEQQREFLKNIYQESLACFSPSAVLPAEYEMEPSLHQSFGGEQLISLYMEQLLISLTRSLLAKRLQGAELFEDKDFISRVCDYFEEQITRQLTLEDICAAFSVSKSFLEDMFHEQTGAGAVDYFNRMRVAAVKERLQRTEENITTVAKDLGYSSSSAMARQFRRYEGMSPTEYKQTYRESREDPIYQRVDYLK